MTILNNNWFNGNSTKRYPLDDIATGESDDGRDFPHNLLVDLRLGLPGSLCKFAAISSIHCTRAIITVTIIGSDSYPTNPGEQNPGYDFKPLAVLSIAQPALVGIPYALTPISRGVVGWIVLGEGVESNYSARFSNFSQAIVLPRLAVPYAESSGVTSISVNEEEDVLIKDVLFKADGDIEVIQACDREVAGVGIVKAIVFRLKQTAGLFKKYKGKCQGRPESDSCDKISVEYINNIPPDCAGNITIQFSGNQIRAQELIIDNPVDYTTGLALEIPLGLAEACTRDDFLPGTDGRLPNQFEDECEGVSDGDQDDTAETGCALEETDLSLSEGADALGLPYLDTLDYEGVGPPSFFTMVNSTFTYATVASKNGLKVTSFGSKFLALWVSPLASDRSYIANYTTAGASETTGNRLSISFLVTQGGSNGSPGVVLDYTTEYSSSLGCYIRTYIMGAFDYRTRRLVITQWRGADLLSGYQSAPIQGIVTGQWYSLDFLKDTQHTFIQYKLHLYNFDAYWVAGRIDASGNPVPAPGIAEPLGLKALGRLEVEYIGSTPLPSTGLSGFGTVDVGAVTFYNFYVM